MEKVPADLTIMIALGEQVFVARNVRQWTQEDLAEYAGTDRTTISKIERGVGNPTLTTIIRIGRALEKNFAELLPCHVRL